MNITISENTKSRMVDIFKQNCEIYFGLRSESDLINNTFLVDIDISISDQLCRYYKISLEEYSLGEFYEIVLADIYCKLCFDAFRNNIPYLDTNKSLPMCLFFNETSYLNSQVPTEKEQHFKAILTTDPDHRQWFYDLTGNTFEFGRNTFNENESGESNYKIQYEIGLNKNAIVEKLIYEKAFEREQTVSFFNKKVTSVNYIKPFLELSKDFG